MADRTVKYILTATTTGFVSGMKTAQGAAKGLNDTLMKNEQAARDVTTGLGLIGAGAVAGAGLAIKTYASFDKQMSAVKATGGATAAEFAKLRDAAIDAGASTAFSATEAAAGVENLLKAGVQAQDVLGGGLAGTLDLAAAGELGVADAAEIAATALTQFKLGGEDVTHVADLLAAGAGKANGDVSDLAQALAQGGLVAAQTGLTIEETTASLSAFASAGLMGSDAGTSLKTMLQRLSAPTKENAEYMKSLGISAYDAQGNFVGMEALAGQMTTAFGDMTPAARNAALATIFGADAVRAASVVYDQGAAGIQGWIDKVNDQGYAAEVAATRLDNLSGDVEALGGAMESAFIRAGSGGNDALRGLVQGATSVVNALGEIPGPVLSTTALIVGGGGLVALGVAGMGKLAIGINNARAAVTALGVSMKTAKIAAAGVGGAIAIAAVGLTVWAQNAAEARARTDEYKDTLDALGNATEETSKKMIGALTEKGGGSNWIDNILGRDGESAVDIAKKMGLSIEDLTAAIEGQAGAMDKVNAAAAEYIDKAGFMEADDRINDQARLNAVLTEQADAYRNSADETSQASEAGKNLGIAQGDLAGDYSAATGAIEEQADALRSVIDLQREAAGEVLDLRSAQREFRSSVDDAKAAIEENGATLDINSEKGRANAAALDDVARSALDVADSMEKNGATQTQVAAQVESSRASFVTLATSMGMSRKRANELADSLGLIPGNYEANITADTRPADQSVAGLQQRLKGLRATVGVSADTTLAQMQINALRNQRSIIIGVSRVEAKAAGGPIYGGTPGKDSVPIMAMPGEHMLTTKDVAAMGGQAGVYAFRQALHSGLAGYASGGAVGSAERAVSSWTQQVRALRKRKASDARDKALDRAERNLDEARARLDRLREQQYDTRLDVARGGIREQATSGLSGAYSVSDRMRSLLRSGDLTGSHEKSLAKSIQSAEPAMKRLYVSADKVAASLEKARDRAADLRQISDGVASRLSGEQSLGDSVTEGSYRDVVRTNARGDTWTEQMWDPGGATSKGLVADAKAKAAGIKAFAGKLSQLQKMGLSGVILSEVAELGSAEGTLVADALIKGGKGDVGALNAAYKDIAKYSTAAGQYVTEGFYKGGVAAADGLVKGLESQEKSIEAQITKIAKGMESALKKALGIKSPSRVMRDLMHYVGDGAVLGLKDSEPGVSRAAARLMSLPSSLRLPPVSSNVNAPAPSGGGITVHVDNITTVDVDRAVAQLEARMRDSVVSHGLTAGVLV